MGILIYKVEDKKIIQSDDYQLDSNFNYIIIDKNLNRPKIWVWQGSNSNLKDKYFAGVSATAIKTQESLYGSSIEVVEAGSEPDQFPKIDQSTVIIPTSKNQIELSTLSKEVPIKEQNIIMESPKSDNPIKNDEEMKNIPVITPPFQTEESQIIPEIPIIQPENKTQIENILQNETKISDLNESKSKNKKDISKVNVMIVHKVKKLLRDITHDLENSLKKIERFLVDYE